MIKINTIIPTYIIEKSDNKDTIKNIQDNIFYIIGNNGIHQVKKNDLYTVVQKIEKVNFLGDVEKNAEITYEKIKENMFKDIEQFFANIYKEYSSEVNVLLYYNTGTGEWLWTVPEQTVSGASVHYKINEKMKIINAEGEIIKNIPESFKMLGSIHSHGSMSAFHSGTDDSDEFNFDGLHITIGDFDSLRSYSLRWIVSGEEITIDFDEAIEVAQSNQKDFSNLMENVKKTVNRNLNIGVGSNAFYKNAKRPYWLNKK